MSKVKDILGLVVRSITKRILGNNVPPMPKADGTLLFHLKRIKDGVKAAYDAFSERKIAVDKPRDIDNLKDVILGMHIPIANNGIRECSTFGELVLGDTSQVTEFVDYETNFNNTADAWGKGRNNTNITKLYPNLQKITFAKKHSITKINIVPNQCLIMPQCKEITLNIESCGTNNDMSFMAIVGYSDVVEKINMPYFKYGCGTYGYICTSVNGLKELNLPVYTGTTNIEGEYGTAGIQSTSLEYLNLPELVKYDHYGALIKCSNLKTLLMPKAKVFGQRQRDNGCAIDTPMLEELRLGTVNSISTGTTKLSNSNMPNLALVEVGNGTTIFPNAVAWTATNVADDLLNINFKTYFAERLATFTDGSVHTLTFCQSFYDRLTEENKTILANKGWTIAIAEA